MELLDRATFLATLPRKRVAAGSLIRDDQGRVCLVDPTYKDLWQLPGGMVEADESPRTGCRREVIEELGIDAEVGRLLLMDWVAPDEVDQHGALILVYDGGVWGADSIDLIVVPAAELHGHAFVAVGDLPVHLSPRNQARLRLALAALQDGST